MTGFAHAADDDAATSSLDHGDGADKRLPEAALDPGAECSKTSGFGFERAQCAGDQRVVALTRGRVFAVQHRFRLGEVEHPVARSVARTEAAGDRPASW